MAIGDDWGVDYTNKRVYRSVNNNVYDVNALYSWLMDLFDELVQMDNPVPMSAQTPTEYTMINEWFIDDESVKYLKNGAIKTSGYNGKIQVLKLDAITADPVPSDIGKMVTEGGADRGALLAYEIDPGGVADTGKWWIRTTTTIGDGSAMAITGGTGAGTADGASVTGEDLYANVYTLGTITNDPSAQIYIFQAGAAIAEWSDKTNWDRGHIDVLIKVKEAGTEIAEAVITVFARQMGDLYDNYEIDLTAGGRNAVPIATATDLDNATAEYYLLYDGGNGTDFTVGEIVNADTAGWSFEVVSFVEYASGVGLLGFRGLKGSITDNDAFTGASSTATGVANGTKGDTLLSWDAGTDPTTLGQTMTGGTSGAKRLLRGVDATYNKGVCQVDTSQTGTNRDPQYKTFQDNEVVTGSTDGSVTLDANSITLVSGWDDITIAFVNGTATYDTGSATEFINGERVTFTGGEGILLLDSNPGGATGTITLGNMTITAINGLVITGDLSGAYCTATQNLQSAHTMQKAFEQAALKNYDIIVECGKIYQAGRTVADVYQYFKFVTREDSLFKMYTVVSAVITILDGEEYIIAYTGYTPKKASPLATFAGGVLFGAQGLWIEGMATADERNYTLIDSDGTKQDPPNKQPLTVTALVAGDRASIFRTSGGIISKDLYPSDASGNIRLDSTFIASGVISVDTPSAGVLRVVDKSEKEEHRLRYASWQSGEFTLKTLISGMCRSGGTATILCDTSGDFLNKDIKIGDNLTNVSDQSWAHVAVISSNKLITTALKGGSSNVWASGHPYRLHVLPVTYVSGDMCYVPFIDEEAVGTEVTVTVIYTADRPILTRVRKKGIIPFEIAGNYVAAGYTVAAIRTADPIFTS